jgi:uncharacterized protein
MSNLGMQGCRIVWLVSSQKTSKNEAYWDIKQVCYNGVMKFEWDDNKAVRNLSKHGVSFDEAKTIFDDPLYVDFYDPDHSDDEERYLIIGESNRGRLLIVSYTERKNLIRIISARQVTRSEREAYEED